MKAKKKKKKQSVSPTWHNFEPDSEIYLIFFVNVVYLTILQLEKKSRPQGQSLLLRRRSKICAANLKCGKAETYDSNTLSRRLQLCYKQLHKT